MKTKNQRESTTIRYSEIRAQLDTILAEIGELKPYVSKTFIYQKLRDKTGLSVRTLQRILADKSVAI